MEELFAEDVGHYWRTGQSSPDTWIDRAKGEISAAGGTVVSEAYGSDEQGRAAFMLEFMFFGERFRAIWPVLKSRTNNQKAARIQAATFLYHDVKARCMSAKVIGPRAAFFSYLMLPDGRTVSQVATPEIASLYPLLLTSGPNDA
jgi:hypothetical protein